MRPRPARLLLAFCLAALALPIAAAAPGDAILGEWRGSSVCIHQPPGSPCKDETVRYTFTRAEGAAAPYHLVADKFVAGEWGTMGEMDFVYSAEDGRWICRFEAPRCPHCTWWFQIAGEALVGGLTDASGVELREAKAARPAP